MVLAREVYLGTSDGFELELPLHLLSLTWVSIVHHTSLWSAFVRILSRRDIYAKRNGIPCDRYHELAFPWKSQTALHGSIAVVDCA